MNNKLIVMVLLFFFLSNKMNALAQDQAIIFQEAFLKKDSSLLSAQLAPDFAIAGHTHAAAQYRLGQILQKYPINKVKGINKKNASKSGKLYFEFIKSDGTSDTSLVKLDKDGRIRYVSLFDKLYGLKRNTTANLRATIPFENHNGSIYLKVHINNYPRPLKLLFDTGADGMAVHESLAKEIGLQVTRKNNASVVGAEHQIQVSDRNNIQLDSLLMEEMSIAIFPDNPNEENDGIIGNTLLRRYITSIDFDKNIIQLYDFGDWQYPKTGKLVKINFPNGLIELPASLNLAKDKSYNGQFIFDSGANYNLICFRPFVRTNKLLISGFKPDIQSVTSSFGINSPTFTGRSESFQIESLTPIHALPVSLMGGTAQNNNWEAGSDGSIGIRLISRYNLMINLSENEMCFLPNMLNEFPQDFILGKAIFGWDNRGKLKLLVNQTVNAIPSKANLNIHSINNYSDKQIRENPKLIDEIKALKAPVKIKFEDNSSIII